MTDETLRFILQVAAIFCGGGSVQLIVMLVRRRAEIRQLNTSSDVNVSTAGLRQAEVSEKLISQLQADGSVHREQVADLQQKVIRLEDRYTQAQRGFTEDLRIAHAENARLATRVAQLQTDLDIATRQLAELRRRFPADG